jgi:hypothetical protein
MKLLNRLAVIQLATMLEIWARVQNAALYLYPYNASNPSYVARALVSLKGPYPTNPTTIASGKRPLALELLRYAATAEWADCTNRIAPHPLEEGDERQFSWVLKAGLGPLLCRAADAIGQVPMALRSADLTAQVKNGNLVDTANEIIDACHSVRVIPTILKGISISDQHYPAGHLRPMGDIDILVPEQAHELVESTILRLGYSWMPNYQLDQDSVHGVPLFRPERGVWVEVHTALFPARDRLRRNSVFSPAYLDAQSVDSTFHGRPVRRFSNELQLLYTASFWIRDLSREGFHASYLPPLFDAIYLLKNSNQTLDWDWLLGSLDNELAKASLYIMLDLLSRYGLHDFPPSILARLASSQEIVGNIELKLIHFMLENHLIRGRPFTRLFKSWHVWDSLLAPGSHAAKLLLLPWNIAFPEHFQNRYSLRYQLERVGRLLRTLR